jgi:putative transposase
MPQRRKYSPEFKKGAVEMAIWQRQGDWSVILHSDRGSQFRSGDYQKFLKRNNLTCSMSAVGHCGDNAACEGFFGMLKRERVHRKKYRTMDIARVDIFNYVERVLHRGYQILASRLHCELNRRD